MNGPTFVCYLTLVECVYISVRIFTPLSKLASHAAAAIGVRAASRTRGSACACCGWIFGRGVQPLRNIVKLRYSGASLVEKKYWGIFFFFRLLDVDSRKISVYLMHFLSLMEKKIIISMLKRIF